MSLALQHSQTTNTLKSLIDDIKNAAETNVSSNILLRCVVKPMVSAKLFADILLNQWFKNIFESGNDKGRGDGEKTMKTKKTN